MITIVSVDIFILFCLANSVLYAFFFHTSFSKQIFDECLLCLLLSTAAAWASSLLCHQLASTVVIKGDNVIFFVICLSCVTWCGGGSYFRILSFLVILPVNLTLLFILLVPVIHQVCFVYFRLVFISYKKGKMTLKWVANYNFLISLPVFTPWIFISSSIFLLIPWIFFTLFKFFPNENHMTPVFYSRMKEANHL